MNKKSDFPPLPDSAKENNRTKVGEDETVFFTVDVSSEAPHDPIWIEFRNLPHMQRFDFYDHCRAYWQDKAATISQLRGPFGFGTEKTLPRCAINDYREWEAAIINANSWQRLSRTGSWKP